MPDDILRRAIALLARREHSGGELTQKLSARGFNDSDIRRAVTTLKNGNFLSDARFAASYVRQKRRYYGDIRLRLELKKRGVAEEDIARALNQQDDDKRDDKERAAAVLERQYPNGLAADKEATARRFLRARGFDADAINAAVAAGKKR